jgi:hypothetical protein
LRLSGYFFILALAVLLIGMQPAACSFYEVTEGDTGWTTGLRHNLNVSLNLSGSSIGEGRFSRYTEMNLNDVRMMERIAGNNGTLDTDESVRLIAEEVNSMGVNLVKRPGNQNYYITVNESWPVAMSAVRSLDFHAEKGGGISDRDFYGNNLDYVGASYFRSTDLKKEKVAFLQLNRAQFLLGADDATKCIFLDRSLPDKRTIYKLESKSTGLVNLKYRQVTDRRTRRVSERRTISNEGDERYEGTVSIARQISMISPGIYEWSSNSSWLECCPELLQTQVLERQVFGT